MRLDLVSQGVELSKHEPLGETRAFSLARGKARAGVQDIVQHQDAGIQEEIGEQPVVELGEPEEQIGRGSGFKVWVKSEVQIRRPCGRDDPRGGAGKDMHKPGQDGGWLHNWKLAAEAQDEWGGHNPWNPGK